MIESNPVRAYIWYRFAAAAGDTEAASDVAYFNKQLSENQIEQAERLINDWKRGQCEKDLQSEPVFKWEYLADSQT